MSDRRNIWIDTDPGIDDAIAISAAFAASDRLKVCGISTVAGNQTIDIVTRNAKWLTKLLQVQSVPIVQGADRPLIRTRLTAGDIHGKHGLGYIIPESETEEYITEEHTTDDHTSAKSDISCEAGRSGMHFDAGSKAHSCHDSKRLSGVQGAHGIYRGICSLSADEKMTLIVIGPMTNIALLVRAFPDVKDRIDQIVCMGGSTVEGNRTPTAEFNIWADPEAAQIVFQSGIPVVMCGLDVTMKCLLDRQDIERLGRSGSKGEFFEKMLSFYLDSPAYREKGAVAMHDSVPVLYLLHEEIFSGEHHVINVSCTEDMCRGRTVICDGAFTYVQKPEPKNAYVLMDADSEVFRKELMELLLSYDA